VFYNLITASNKNIVHSALNKIINCHFVTDIGGSATEPQIDGIPDTVTAVVRWVGAAGDDLFSGAG